MWLSVPVEGVINKEILQYIDFLWGKRLKPKTINCHLDSIRGFYEYLYNEEEIRIPNPVKRGYALKESKPLPRHLRYEDVDKLFDVIKNLRDRAMFKVMLRCGLRVEEIANLTLGAIYLRRRLILVHDGKGGKDRVVYISDDAHEALVEYLELPPEQRKSFWLRRAPIKENPYQFVVSKKG